MTKTTRNLASLVLALALAVVIALCMRMFNSEPLFSAQMVSVDSMSTFPACESEDSVNCYWDAQGSGNGEGLSFVAIGVPDGAWLLYSDGHVEFYAN